MLDKSMSKHVVANPKSFFTENMRTQRFIPLPILQQIYYVKHRFNSNFGLPSSAFWSHSTNCLSCSVNKLLPLLAGPSLYHFRTVSSDNISAKHEMKEQLSNLNIF